MGFFKISPELAAATRKTELTGCAACKLDQSAKDSVFAGEGKDKVLFLCDHPRGKEGNDSETVFLHKMYDFLWDIQGKRGLPKDFLESAWLGYVIPCPCEKDAEPKPDCCRDRLNRLINELKPSVIIPMGPAAIQALIWDRMAGRIKNTPPSEFYGKQIPDHKYNCWICPTYSPEFLTWQRDDECPYMYFAQHIRGAYRVKDTPLPKIPTDIRTTGDPMQAAEWVNEIIKWAETDQLDKSPEGYHDVAIDYETTGLKPHREGHAIKVASVGYRKDGEYHAIAFWWDNECKPLIDAWYGLTHSDIVGLVAHKADYEACWTRFRAGPHGGRTEWPTNWSWDTCLGAHVIDNNQKVGLKLHTYCELGVIGYDTDADDYLKPKDDDPVYGKDSKGKYSCNAFNVLKYGIGILKSDIMNYCAQDSLYTIMLRDIQSSQMAGMEKPFRFFMEGMDALAKVQSEGLPIDFSHIEELMNDLDNKFLEAKAETLNTEEVKLWKAKHIGEEFNPMSNTQVVEVLYKICKLKPPSGKADASGDTLEKLGTPFCQSILLMRRWLKIKDFLKGYKREAVWDEEKQSYLIRPFFNLSSGASSEDGGPSTYRTSSSDPNFQNIPKRDKEMKKILRSLFVAPKGYRFMECDYKALETYISVAYNKDPQLLAYLKDPTLDMHKRAASLVFGVTPEEVTKDMRQQGKKWNFSSFYGSGYKNSAFQIWKDCTPEMKDTLKKHTGVGSLDEFEGQCKKAYDVYWGHDFKVYDQWRKKQWEIYQTMGYLTSYFGFRFYGPMGATNTMNCCIQGTGAHCLLEGLIQDLKDFDHLGLKSRIVGEIHDSIVVMVADDEVEKVCSIIYKNNVKALNDKYDWLPLKLVEECDLSEAGGSWSHMEECGACCEDGLENKDWRAKADGGH